jgi:hypothetical protein
MVRQQSHPGFRLYGLAQKMSKGYGAQHKASHITATTHSH